MGDYTPFCIKVNHLVDFISNLVYKTSAMKPNFYPKRRVYSRLGTFLKEARGAQRVEDIAKQLNVTSGFVYQVEKGLRKPRDAQIGQWASVYGVRPQELWKRLDRVSMDLVASLKDEGEPIPVDPFTQLTNEEKTGLLPYLNYVRWKIDQGAKKPI